MAWNMHNIIEYIPKVRDTPSVVKVVSAWCDIPTILKDIIVTFNINPQTALEFGVEYGYSTSALANYFTKVIGVDTFMGDIHSNTKRNHYKVTKRTLKNRYKNIQLIQSSYQDISDFLKCFHTIQVIRLFYGHMIQILIHLAQQI